MNKEVNNRDEDQSGKRDDQNIEWDNGEVTYGHSIANSEFRRKNTPNEEHIAKTEDNSKTIEELKNSNLSQGEDIGNRNDAEEKGLGGKDL
ncbi:MAG: hypothetical protein EOO86_13800 [Pedobacter sp.]|nr:MAG: hypothetical protein EOO86_13800 [Pedobacter sp.]